MIRVFIHEILHCYNENKGERKIKNKSLKPAITTIFLLILMLNLTSNIFIVSGEAGGTGKFLEINFTTVDPAHEVDLLTSDSTVTAKKVSSGQVFTYIASNSETYSQKVGAGTVLLEATPADGWIFSHFLVRGDEEPNLSEYKTQKYDVVDAVFDRLSYTVVASVGRGLGTISADGVNIGTGGEVSVYHGESVTFNFEPDPGYYVSSVLSDSGPITSPYTLGPITEEGHWIEVNFELYTYDVTVYVVDGLGQVKYGTDIIADEDNDELNPAIVTVDWGTAPTFEFIPYEGEPDSYHLSAVLVDGTDYIDLVLTEFTQSYTFDPIKEDGHSLAVTFSVDGQADIPSGDDVTVFLSNAASLTFDTVGEGYAFGNEILAISPGDVVVWEITVDATVGTQVIVALRYDDTGMSLGEEENLRMYRSDLDYELWLRCDFNGDGVIDGQDVKKISNIVKHPRFLPDPDDPTADPPYQWYVNTYDLDENGVIDENDIHVVNSMKDIEWLDITYGPVDTVNNIIYGLTDHFSIFRAR